MKVLISENRDNNSINYTLEDKEIFSNVEYKVLRNAEADGFIKCVKISHNGKLKLVYDISPYRDLLSLTREMSLNSFLTVVTRLISTVINVGENGFMQYKNINPNISSIFVDTNNLNVYMIYLPLQYEGNDSEEIFIREFKNNIIKAISLNRNFYGETTTGLRNNLISDKSLTVILKELNNKNKVKKAKKAPVNAIPENVKPDKVEPKNIVPVKVLPNNEAPVKEKPVIVEPHKVVPKKALAVNDAPKKALTVNDTSKIIIPNNVVPNSLAPALLTPVDTDSKIEERNRKRGKSLLGSLDKFINKALENHAQMDIVEDYYGDSQTSIVGEMIANSKIVSKQEEEKKSLSSISSISTVSNADETTTTFMKALSQSFLSSVVEKKEIVSMEESNEGSVEEVRQRPIEEVRQKRPIENKMQSIISNAQQRVSDYGDQSIQGDGLKTLVLKRMNTTVPLSFVISKKEYAIGSNKYMVDGVIDNKAVSRLHCIVTIKNNQYYIQDIDSKNGTYVNSLRLQKNVMTKINVGDKVSIANCDFLVREIEI